MLVFAGEITSDTSLSVQFDPNNNRNTNSDPLLLNSVSTEEVFKGTVDLVMYRPVKLTNTSKEMFLIRTSNEAIEVASNSTKEIMLTENVIDMISGNSKRTVTLLENQKPTVNVQRLVQIDGKEIHLSTLQKVTGYRVTIKDDFTEQLDISVTGPVKYKIVKQTPEQVVIDITLDAYRSYQDFERIADNSSDEGFESYFNIKVNDLYAPHEVLTQGMFRFTEW
jgi:hypothetical protein